MAVNLTNAESVLKQVYLDVISEQLNTGINPLFAKIKQTTNDVYGKDVRKVVTFGLNGGIGSGEEDGALPKSGGNNYKQMVATLKNLYGTIEISDKALRATENNSASFVNLLNAEMEGLIKASNFNLGRMLFGDGTGVLCKVVASETEYIEVDSVDNLVEGMMIDVRYDDGAAAAYCNGRRILSIDKDSKRVVLNDMSTTLGVVVKDMVFTTQNGFGNEITGIKAIFNDDIPTLYGLGKAENSWLRPYVKRDAGEITELALQTALDTIEEKSGSGVNFIVCSWGVRRALQALFASNRTNVDVVNLEGGFKTISYNGIPVYADRFCPKNTMYLLNTDDFAIHQLCDWQWLEGNDGSILKQVPGKPVYTATLVKYAELLCSRPCGQGMITGITEI